MARLYRSRVRPGRSAVLAMSCAALGSALLLAIGWQWLGAYGNLLFVGTVARGLLIGVLLGWVCRRAHFSWPRMAGLIAATATLLAIVGSHYQAHWRDRASQLADASELLLLSTDAGGDPVALQAEYEVTIHSLSFANYFRRYFGFEGQAKDGAAALWNPWAGLSLYALEIAAALFLSTLYPAGQASEPVCTRCARWQEEQILGTAAYGATAALTKHLLAGNSKEAALALRQPDTNEHLELSLATCHHGHDKDGGGVLRVREHFYDKRSRNILVRDRIDLLVNQSETEAITARLETWS